MRDNNMPPCFSYYRNDSKCKRCPERTNCETASQETEAAPGLSNEDYIEGVVKAAREVRDTAKK